MKTKRFETVIIQIVINGIHIIQTKNVYWLYAFDTCLDSHLCIHKQKIAL